MGNPGTEDKRGGIRRTLTSIPPLIWRVLIIVVWLGAWEWLPQIQSLQNIGTMFNPSAVSSPSKVGESIWALLVGGDQTATIWPYLLKTLQATMLGVVGGVFLGGFAGLVLSSNHYIDRVLRPFVYAFNTVPRVALIPVVVIIVGPNLTATSVTSGIMVFFLTFFNAYEGGRSIQEEVLDSARILGANTFEVMMRVRLRYVAAWTFASIPNAISFGLVGTVTAEILIGSDGVGQFLNIALQSADSAATLATAFILGLVGMLLVLASNQARDRILHWWAK